MTDRSKFERFSGNNFLLERGQATLRYLTQRWQQRLLSFIVRLLLFGGFLGLMWTLSHLHPHGDLSLYMIPITLLALPIGFIAPQEKSWEKALNFLFLSAFFGFLIWSGVWYFQYFEWGYQFRWFFLETCLLIILTWISWRRLPKSWDGPQQTLLRHLWFVGLLIIFSALGFLGYYIGNQKSPEAGTANILTGSTFIFFLSLTIIRVFWLDGIRLRRANRGEHVAPQDYILLLEWLIPRSYAFVVALAMLLIAESMMFSTIYKATQAKRYQEQQNIHQKVQYTPPPWEIPQYLISQYVINPESEDSKKTDSTSQKTEGHTSTQREHKKTEVRSPYALNSFHLKEVNLAEWIFFSFKPYVFPKDDAGREIEAPKWFKYLGRALLGLIFAILLTKQLNIWKQLGALYMILLGATKRLKLRGTSTELKQQQKEMIANFKRDAKHSRPFLEVAALLCGDRAYLKS